jgi:hypothetical protein
MQSTYSRAQAIADGVLVDVTEMAKDAGFKYPVAFTRAVWDCYVESPPWVDEQDEAGRTWDILVMVRHAFWHWEDDSEVFIQLHEANVNRDILMALRATCGPNDDGNPCITVRKEHCTLRHRRSPLSCRRT